MARSVKGMMVVALAVSPAACHPPEGSVTGALLAPCPANAAPSDTAQLHACIAHLDFDTLTAAGDEQRLLVRDTVAGTACHGDESHSCRHGPLAKIEPVVKAHKRSNAQLDEGRIIARLYLRDGETEPYPKLGLAPTDTTYWWVQRTSPTTAVSRFIRVSGDSAVATEQEEILIESHPSGSYRQALARFLWDDADEKTQGPCGSGCCRGS